MLAHAHTVNVHAMITLLKRLFHRPVRLQPTAHYYVGLDGTMHEVLMWDDRPKRKSAKGKS